MLETVLEQFGVQLIADLGGRQNWHWLVERGGERFALRRSAQPRDEIAYEIRLLAAVAALGWPVAPVIDGPIVVGDAHWTLAPFLAGEPPPDKYSPREQQVRGRLMAEFHADLAQLERFGQRGVWRRCEEILADGEIDRFLAQHAQRRLADARILQWHLQRARERLSSLALPARAPIVIHGDFTPWNLRFQGEHLSAILDFEMARVDYRIAEFALAWRGRYDDVVHAYNAIAPLDPEEWALLTPLWWAFLIEEAYRMIRSGIDDDGWVIKQILRRSPLMGPDAAAYDGG
jgi:Ser/Thr protein kinase RdoA (MazF antagonist)